MQDMTNSEILTEFERLLIWLCIKSEHGESEETEKLQEKISKIRREIEKRMT